MCTVVIATQATAPWPLLLAANRDEMLARPWLPPARHWPEQPDVVAGLDTLGGGTWLGLNDAGVVATVLNRPGTLGPAPGKRSRGALPLLALRHATAEAATGHLAGLDGGEWRSFNLVVADRAGAYFLRGTGEGAVTAERLLAGIHMVTAFDPDDLGSPRVARHLPRFRAAPLPAPPDWSSWTTLLTDNAAPREAALFVPAQDGFGTVSSTLVGVGNTGCVPCCGRAGRVQRRRAARKLLTGMPAWLTPRNPSNIAVPTPADQAIPTRARAMRALVL